MLIILFLYPTDFDVGSKLKSINVIIDSYP